MTAGRSLSDLRALLAAATARPWFTMMRSPEFEGDAGSLDISAGDGYGVAEFFPPGRLGADAMVGYTPDQYAEGEACRRLCIAAVNALPGLLDVVEAAREYEREKTSPAPDFTMIHLRRDQLFTALSKLDEVAGC